MFLCSCTGDSFRDHIRRGNRYYRAATDTLVGDSTLFDQAVTEYQRALSKDSTIALAHYNLGNTKLFSGQDSTAFAEYLTADSLERDYNRQAHIHRNIGVLLEAKALYAGQEDKMKLLSAAVESYKSSLRFDPKNDETRYNLALCLWQLKKAQQDQQSGGGGDGEDSSDEKDEQNQQQQQQDAEQQEVPQQESRQQKAEEQMIEDAMQREKDTQRRLNMYEQRRREQEMYQVSRPRRLQKNW